MEITKTRIIYLWYCAGKNIHFSTQRQVFHTSARRQGFISRSRISTFVSESVGNEEIFHEGKKETQKLNTRRTNIIFPLTES